SVDYLAITQGFTPLMGKEVCAVGAVSGLICGKVVGSELVLTPKKTSDNSVYLISDVGKIDTGGKAFVPGDSGGPVFIKTSDTTAQAVGHILGGVKGFWKNFVYYMPLSKTLSAWNFELVTAQTCPIIQKKQTEVKQVT